MIHMHLKIIILISLSVFSLGLNAKVCEIAFKEKPRVPLMYRSLSYFDLNSYKRLNDAFSRGTAETMELYISSISKSIEAKAPQSSNLNWGLQISKKILSDVKLLNSITEIEQYKKQLYKIHIATVFFAEHFPAGGYRPNGSYELPASTKKIKLPTFHEFNLKIDVSTENNKGLWASSKIEPIFVIGLKRSADWFKSASGSNENLSIHRTGLSLASITNMIGQGFFPVESSLRSVTAHGGLMSPNTYRSHDAEHWDLIIKRRSYSFKEMAKARYYNYERTQSQVNAKMAELWVWLRDSAQKELGKEDLEAFNIIMHQRIFEEAKALHPKYTMTSAHLVSDAKFGIIAEIYKESLEMYPEIQNRFEPVADWIVESQMKFADQAQ